MDYLLVHIELAEDLGRIQEVLVLIDPESRLDCHHLYQTSKEQSRAGNALLCIERQHRQVQNDRDPVAVNYKQEGQESVHRGFGNNVGVETVAKINGINVVTAFKSKSARMLYFRNTPKAEN